MIENFTTRWRADAGHNVEPLESRIVPSAVLELPQTQAQADKTYTAEQTPVDAPFALYNAEYDLGTLTALHTLGGTISYFDIDEFSFNTTQRGGLRQYVEIDGHGLGDLNLYLLDANGTPIRQSATFLDSDERIALDGLAAGTYIVHVEDALYNGYYSPTYDLEIRPPGPDEAEPNNTQNAATNLGHLTGVHDEYYTMYGAGNEDWFRFDMGFTGSASDFVRIQLNHSYGDLDLQVYDEGNNRVGSYSVTNEEFISLNGFLPGAYWVRVYGATNPSYRLTIDAPAIPADPSEPNNTSGTRTSLGLVTGEFTVPTSFTIHSTSDVDWFSFSTARTGAVTNFVELFHFASAGDLDIALYDSSLNLVDDSSGVGNFEAISLANLPAGLYYVKVTGYLGATNSYGIRFNAPQGAGLDALEGQENLLSLAGLRVWNDLSIHNGSDRDTYTFQIGPGGTADHFVAINFTHSAGDLDLLLSDSAGNLISYSVGVGDSERVSLANLAAGIYKATIYGGVPNETNPNYSLVINAPGTAAAGADRFEANNTRETARLLDLRGRQIVEEHLAIATGDQDWFKFTLAETGQKGNFAAIALIDRQGDLDLTLLDSAGAVLATSAGARNVERISLEGRQPGTYYLKVAGYLGATNPDYAVVVNAPGGDWAEGNDTAPNARNLNTIVASSTFSDLSIHKTGNEDWFKFTTAGPGKEEDYVRIDFSHSLGDLDLKLYAADGTTVLGSSVGTSDSERVSLQGLAAGSYLVRVYGFGNAINPRYQLTIDGPVDPDGDEAEPNNTRATATDLALTGAQTPGLRTYFGRTEPYSIHSASDVDWFTFTMAEDGSDGHFAALNLDHTKGDLDLELYDVNGDLKATSTGVNDLQLISLRGRDAGQYYLKVTGYAGATNPNYGLLINAPWQLPAGDRAEANETQANAKDLATVSGSWTQTAFSLHQTGDEDWFKFRLPAAGTATHSASVSFSHALGDIDLELVDGAGTVMRSSRGVSGTEQVSLQGLTANTDYYLRVYGFQRAPNPDYTLHFEAPATAGDWAEGNNSATAPHDLRTLDGFQSFSGLSVHVAGDEDWFKFALSGAAQSGDYAAILFDSTLGDLDLAVYDQSGATVLGRSETAGGFEFIDLKALANGGTAGTYLVKVSGFRGATNPNYALLFDGPETTAYGDWAEGNNTRTAARDLRQVEGTQQLSGLTIHQSGDEDWFKFTTVKGAVDGHSLQVDFDHTQGDLSLVLYDSAGAELGRSDGVSDRESISLSGLPAGAYYFRVAAPAGVTGAAYTATLQTPANPVADWAEANNTASTATNLRALDGTLAVAGLSLHTGTDQDWFKFTITAPGVTGQNAVIEFNHAEGDLRLDLYNADGTMQRASSATSADFEQVSLAGLAAGTYLVKVSGAANPTYSLTIGAAAALAPDRLEVNDTIAGAYNLRNIAEVARSSRFNFPLSSGNVPLGNYSSFEAASIAATGPSSGLGSLAAMGGVSSIFNSLQSNLLGVYGNGGSFGGGGDFLAGLGGSSGLISTGWGEQGIYSPSGLGLGVGTSALLSVLAPSLSGFGSGFGSSFSTPAPVVNPLQQAASLGTAFGLAQLLGGGTPTSVAQASLAPFGGFGFGLSYPTYSYPTYSYPSYSYPTYSYPTYSYPSYGGGAPAYSGAGGLGAILGAAGLGLPFLRAGTQSTLGVDRLSIHSATDVDLFSFDLASEGADGQFVAISFAHAQGDLKLELLQQNGSVLEAIDTSDTAGDAEQIGLEGLAPGRYFARVSGVNGATNPEYSLALSAALPPDATGDALEPNNSATAAHALRVVEGTRTLAGLSLHQAGDEDWFEFETKAAGQPGHSVRIDFAHQAGDLDLVLYNAGGAEVLRSAGTGDGEEVSLAGLAAGTYRVKVFGYSNATNPAYALTVTAPDTSILPDRLEPNNDSGPAATNLDRVSGVTSLNGLTLHKGLAGVADDDHDYFKFTTVAAGGAGNYVSVSFEHAIGNLSLELRNSSGTVVATSATTSDVERVSLAGLPAGTYYAHVFGPAADTANSYDLKIDAPTAATQGVDDWTVLVYMTASDLAAFAASDINEMETATAGLPGSVNFAVLWDQSHAPIQSYATGAGTQSAWQTTGRAIIQPDTRSNVIATTFEILSEQDTGDPATLGAFIDWAVTAAPARNYALVLWDHGGGDIGGFNLDNRDGGPPSQLYTDELVSALAGRAAAFRSNLQLIAFDACNMAMAEVGYALRGEADVFVASEETVNGNGFDYRTAFSSLAANPAAVSPETLGAGLVASYQAQYQGTGTDDTLSASASAAFPAFTAALQSFTSLATNSASGAEWAAMRAARAATTEFQAPDVLDLGQFLRRVGGNSSVTPGLAAAARAAADRLDELVIADTHDARGALGLSIYFPASGGLDASYTARNVAFSGATGWNGFLTAFQSHATGARGVAADWAESNNSAPRAENLHALAGHGNAFTGLTLHDAADVDWFRFTLGSAPAGSDTVSIGYDVAEGKARVSLYKLDPVTNAREFVATSASGDGSEAVGFAGRGAGEYFVAIEHDGPGTPAYLLNVDAPAGSLAGREWVRGNDNSGKAFALGTMSSEAIFSGLSVTASGSDWFTFETPKQPDVPPGTVTVTAAPGATVTVRLYDDSPTPVLLDSETGTGELRLTHPGGTARTFRIEITGAAEAAYALHFEGGGGNQPPVAGADFTLTLAEDAAPQALGLTAPTDADGDPLTFTVDQVPDATRGLIQSGAGAALVAGATLTPANLAALVFVPVANASGAAGEFRYTVNDGQGHSDSQTVTFALTPVNDLPVANALQFSVPPAGAAPLVLTGSDVEGSPLTFAVVSPPAHGALTGTAPNLTYRADVGFAGNDTFTYTVHDGTEASLPVTVTMTVGAVNPGLEVAATLKTRSTTVVPGDTIVTGRATLTNTSSQPVAERVLVEWVFSQDLTLDATDPVIGSLTLSPLRLAKGASRTVSEPLAIPASLDLAQGNYHVLARVSKVDAQGVPLELLDADDAPTPLDLQFAFGQVGDRKGVALSYVEADGTRGRLSLSGPGHGEVIKDASGVKVLLEETTKRTSFKVTTTSAGDGRVALGGLEAATPLGSALLGKVNFSGEFQAAGGITKLQLGDVRDATLFIAPTTGKATITLDRVANVNLNAQIPIATLAATEWLDSGTPDQITAPALDRLKITGRKAAGIAGDFEASVTLAGAAVKSLGGASIAGSLTEAMILTSGSIGAVTLGAMHESAIFAGVDAGLAAGALPGSTADFEGQAAITSLAIRAVNNLTVPAFEGSRIAAWKIGSLKLAGVADSTAPGDAGVVAHSIASYQRLSLAGQVKLGKLTTPGSYDASGRYEATIV